ncbi:type I-D CRISPR-associated protein Cas10d/Csc3 [Kamptonema formosum]|uniref:type I-D CRISPR-associated protein Cas10d/Csc3 n=1 Tax=Kamptonema formosum TaxID=331992 RepID=UPI00034755A0|nr:type I-D CRISPR-associated protein Cas10d/Csc3 [Oscillatoria sp. PCC 10802]
MKTLLQTLLIETLKGDDPILRAYIETVLPAMEREFAFIHALGGSEAENYKLLSRLGDPNAAEKAQRWARNADQSLLAHVLNGLLTAWNLTSYLTKPLSDVEKYLLCLGFTLHDYNKYSHGQGEGAPRAWEIPAILELCQELGEKLEFGAFWPAWQQYLPEIGYLAQNTQFKVGTNLPPANWPKFTADHRRLDIPLRRLLAFGDVAVHLRDPADVGTETAGDRLREHLRFLGIRKKLVYHRLRDCRGLLTNGIHNAVVRFAGPLDWQPILYFAQGAVYLATETCHTLDLTELQEFVWEQISSLLGSKMLGGDIGFKRDGKGLKVAPLTQELFSPADLIRQLPDVIKSRVGNVKDPATPKRLEKLTIGDEEREKLAGVAYIWADRVAEFLILVQREFFQGCEKYAPWVLEALGISSQISPEDTQIESGGVNYGWYHAAARYIAGHPSWSDEDVSAQLADLADRLASWAEENALLPVRDSLTREVFFSYLEQYLEVAGWENRAPSFSGELAAYTAAKARNQWICSLSSGEFPAEEQLEAVVLFKQQQYSNKNALGGGTIKRGISKIWSLEMLLRQALWAAPAGKFEDQQPVFLYIFPAYVYSPQTAAALRLLVSELKDVSLWKVRDCWLDAGMKWGGLQNLPWREDGEVQAVRFPERYSGEDLPFMAVCHTTTQGKTAAEAWVEPAFLALALPMLLGVKVVATGSFETLYTSDKEFFESVILDGPAGFWNLLDLPASLRLQELPAALERLLVTYCLHLDTRSKDNDARWKAFSGTVREVATDVLNVFTLAQEGLRRSKCERPKSEKVRHFWKYAEILANLAKGESCMSLYEKLVDEYRRFYRVRGSESSHAILLPLSIVLETILSPQPNELSAEDLILQGAGSIQKAVERRNMYIYRPLVMDKSVGLDYPARKAQELAAIETFTTTCVRDLFLGLYKGDRAFLQENRNRIKAAAEFAYRRLDLQDKSSPPPSQDESASEEVP